MDDSSKAILKEMGYEEQHFSQIEEAIGVTKYTLCTSDGSEEMNISAKMAKFLLGERDFFSGIARSAFHWSAVREVKDRLYVYFDSSALFREGVA